MRETSDPEVTIDRSWVERIEFVLRDIAVLIRRGHAKRLLDYNTAYLENLAAVLKEAEEAKK